MFAVHAEEMHSFINSMLHDKRKGALENGKKTSIPIMHWAKSNCH